MNSQQNKLAREFDFASLLKFAFPTIVMMVFMSLYTMVDGVFVSRFVGTDALSAVNIVYPLINVIIAVGIMFATGGSAVIARKMGEGNDAEARENFSFIVVTGILIGIAITALGFIFIHPMLRLLGANAAIYDYCYQYAFMLLFFPVMSILQMFFQFFFVTAGRPALGLAVTVTGGIANIVLDDLFIVPLDMGIGGAALATGIGYSIPALYGLWFFLRNRQGSLYLVRPKYDGKVLLESCANGSSEMVSNLSSAVITYLFNIIMMNLLGENGVAAITIVLYAEYTMVSVYLGYSSGVAPVISYNYGNRNIDQLQRIFKISMKFTALSSVVVCMAAWAFAGPIVGIFAPVGSAVYELGIVGFYLYAPAYLFKGMNIFGSSLFTALSNGKASAILSFLRTFLFIAAGILILPYFWGVNGVWLAVPIAEVAAILVTALYIIKLRPLYQYY